jgi:hypothetical protein
MLAEEPAIGIRPAVSVIDIVVLHFGGDLFHHHRHHRHHHLETVENWLTGWPE